MWKMHEYVVQNLSHDVTCHAVLVCAYCFKTKLNVWCWCWVCSCLPCCLVRKMHACYCCKSESVCMALYVHILLLLCLTMHVFACCCYDSACMKVSQKSDFSWTLSLPTVLRKWTPRLLFQLWIFMWLLVAGFLDLYAYGLWFYV